MTVSRQPAAPGLSPPQRAPELLEPLLDAISDGFLMVDSRCRRFLRVNQRAAALLGYSEPALLATETKRVLPPPMDLPESLGPGDRRPARFHTVLKSRQGRPLPVRGVLFSCEIAGQSVAMLVFRPRGDDDAREREDREELTETVLDVPSIIGQSDHIRDVCRLIGLVAKTDATVLVQGESGTGKELVAQAIHFHSHRSRRPLVKVNCAALSETLLESELFGHKKGAFTGAVQDRRGRFMLAHRGTLVLDEISSMPLAGQAKLLRVLQEHEFEPVGASTPVHADVRVVAVTNTDLEKDIAAGRFRQDLYYRLNSFPLRIEPLRERKVDIPLLARHFLKRFARSLQKRIADLKPDALSHLMDYSWPGNVRELSNVIEYATILENGKELSVGSLPDRLRVRKPAPKTLRERMTQVEKRLILEALSKANGVKSHAARFLGIDRRNLGYFLAKHRIRWQSADPG